MFKMVYKYAVSSMLNLYGDDVYGCGQEWGLSDMHKFVLNEIRLGRLISDEVIINYIAMTIEQFLDDDALEEIMTRAIDSYNDKITAH